MKIDESRLKDLFKTALIEVLQERRDLMQPLVDEAVEDAALSRAIKEGRTSKLVHREQVMAVLEKRK